MAKPVGTDPAGSAKVPCDICRKEVPVSEAVIPEAEDYVAYFCGLECYAKWKKQSENTGKQNTKPGK